MKNRLIALLGFILPLTVSAQEIASLVGIGPSNILDTYLTPEQFSGGGLTYLNIREHIKPGKHWGNLIEHEIDLASANDRSKTISMIAGDYNLYWGRYRYWTLKDNGNGTRLRVQAGALANANLGFIYAMMNTNNPAQARIGLNIMPAAVGKYDFRLFRQSFMLRYELNLPLVGIVFSPNYGQSYYEIFSRSNYDHNIVPTTFIAAPNIRQMITIDWKTGKKWNLRLGYLGNYQQTQVNNLKQHIYTHRVMIGLVRSFETTGKL